MEPAIKQTYSTMKEAMDAAWKFYYENVLPVDLLDFNINIKKETDDIRDGLHLELTYKHERIQ